MALKIEEHNPDYKAFEVHSYGHPTQNFMLVHNEYEQSLKDRFKGADETIEPLTKQNIKKQRPVLPEHFQGAVDLLAREYETRPSRDEDNVFPENPYGDEWPSPDEFSVQLHADEDGLPKKINVGFYTEKEQEKSVYAKYATELASKMKDYVPIAEKRQVSHLGEQIGYQLIHKAELKRFLTELSNDPKSIKEKTELFYLGKNSLVPLKNMQQQNTGQYSLEQGSSNKNRRKNRISQIANNTYQQLMEQYGYSDQYSADGGSSIVVLGTTPDRYPDKYAGEQKTLFEGVSPPSTPKQYDWEPPTEIDPAKRTPHPDPKIDLQQKQQWNNKWNIRNMFRDHLANNDLLDDKTKSSTLGHVHKALSLMPRGAIDRTALALKGVGFYPNKDLVVRRSADLNNIHDIAMGEKPANLYPYNREQAGGAMFFDAQTGHIHAPVFESFEFPPAESNYLGTHIQPHQGYMHELAHAIDQGANKFEEKFLSEDNDWIDAWESEMSEEQLNLYSASSPVEGFAEFARLAWTRPKAARKMFPMSYAFFAKHDLVHPRPMQAIPQKKINPRRLEKKHEPSSPGQKTLFTAKRNYNGRTR